LPGPRAGSAEDFVVNVGDRVFFDFDKFNLKPQARETLQRQATWLKKYPSATIMVEGHCDERGTREYNLALGERRANSAKNYLVALGVNPNRIRTISYGKERPAVTGSNEAAWAQNRRAVTVINAAGS
jgi:peptidoglycan-associated lipoprotein